MGIETKELKTGQKRRDDQFLHHLWQAAFRREPDAESRRDFLYRLDRGTSRLVVIEEVFTSEEYGAQANDDRAFARDLYRFILQREPDRGDSVRAWAEFTGAHGREAAFTGFCAADEVVLKYTNEDSYDFVEGPSGVLCATFRRSEVLLTFGSERAKNPMRVGPQEVDAAASFLTRAGFELLARRIEQHFAAPRSSRWVAVSR